MEFNNRFTYYLSLLSVFLFSTYSLIADTSNESYSFLTKAIIYYRNVKTLSSDVNPDKRVIDTNLIHSNKPVEFAKAYETSWHIGLTLLELGKHPQALDIFNEIRSYLEKKSPLTQDDKKRNSAVLNVIGAIYEETGLWNEALGLYMKSLQICNEINFKAGKAKVYNNIGKLYFNRVELGKAEELFLKAIEINKELNIRDELFNNYNNLAGVYMVKKEAKKALDFAMIALNQLDMKKDFYNRSIAYSNIGNLYQEMGNFTFSLSYYRLAAEIQEHKSYLIALMRSYLAIASVYKAMHLKDSAEYFITKSLNLSGIIGNSSQKLIILQDAARYYLSVENYKLSSRYYSDYVNLNDSLESLNSLTKIEQIQAVYEVINKEKNNQILQQKINLQELALQRQRIILIAVSIIFVLLAFFLITLLKNRKQERMRNIHLATQTEELHHKEKELLIEKEHRLELELDYKNRQLTSYALNLARNNELILKTSEELRILLLGLSLRDKDRSVRIKNLLSSLQQQSTGIDWEEFRLYFQEVHQSFEKNLSSSFPDLSPNDKKICALLKLGLSTKDIASITFRELRSVESARNRLRKKLGLAAEINIVNFLSQF